jgi:hypothetical protein
VARDGIMEEAGQARYWYLKGALQQSANLEVDHDKTRVEEYLRNLGFSEPLVQTLNAAEQLYQASATPFELKSCLAHLRSFLEGLHAQACHPIAVRRLCTRPQSVEPICCHSGSIGRRVRR